METIQHIENYVARKAHICGWCEGEIKKGETYEAATYKYDYVYRWKNHIYCRAIANKLDMFDGADDGLTGDAFREYIKDEFSDKFPELAIGIKTFAEQLEKVLEYHNINSLTK